MQTVAQRLEHLRWLGKIGSAELGTLAGVSRSTVGMIESGKRRNPAADTLKSICKVCGDEALWLISGAGKPPTAEVVQSAIARRRVDLGRPAAKADPEAAA